MRKLEVHQTLQQQLSALESKCLKERLPVKWNNKYQYQYSLESSLSLLPCHPGKEVKQNI